MNWSRAFDRARRFTLEMVFWWIKDSSADDQLCVQRCNLFERRENVSKSAEYILDRSISERPRTHSKDNRMRSRSFHFGTVSVFRKHFFFLKKNVLTFRNAFSTDIFCNIFHWVRPIKN